MTISIIVIKPNNFNFIKDKHYHNLENFTKDLEQYITIQSVPFENMMDEIVTNIEMINHPDLHGDTVVCYENEQNIYQVCFLIPETHPNKSVSNVNKIGEFLCGEQMYGTCVVLNSKIGTDKTCSPDNIDVQTLSTILYKKFVHTGLFISCEDNKPVIEYEFIQSPFEYDNNINSTEYRYHDIELFGFTLSFFIKHNDNNIINKRATKLLGEYKVNGDILLVTKSSFEYQDLTKNIYNKLIKLSEGPFSKRKLKDDEQDTDKKINNLPVALNKHIILDNRYKQYKDVCHSCSQPFEDNKFLVCTGCYRLKYHNIECQQSDWSNHKKECLINKKCINSN